MKRGIYIGPSGHYAGSPIHDALMNVYPEGLNGRGWVMRLDSGDSRIQRAMRILQDAGMRPLLGKPKDENWSVEFSYGITCEYEPSDFDGVQHMLFRPPGAEDTEVAYGRAPDGRVIIIPRTISEDHVWAYTTYWGGFAVCQGIRHALERQSMCGMKFKPTCIVEGPRHAQKGQILEWEDYQGERPRNFWAPWWELTSELVLPPMSPKTVLVDPMYERLTRDDFDEDGSLRRSNVTAQLRVPYLKNGPPGTVEFVTEPGEPRYLASDLERMGPFDIALTFERFPARWFIVSRRWYEFCQREKLKACFVPVRLD